MDSHLMGLTVDFGMGFVCFDAASKVSVRQYYNTKNEGFFQGEISNNCIVHSVMKLIMMPQAPFLFILSATCLFCSVCILGVWAHLFWQLFPFPQLKSHTPSGSSFWPLPKSESHADSTGAGHKHCHIVLLRFWPCFLQCGAPMSPMDGEKCCQHIV